MVGPELLGAWFPTAEDQQIWHNHYGGYGKIMNRQCKHTENKLRRKNFRLTLALHRRQINKYLISVTIQARGQFTLEKSYCHPKLKNNLE